MCQRGAGSELPVTPPLQRNKENLRFCHDLRDPAVLKPVPMLEEEELPLWLFICFCSGESALGCGSRRGRQGLQPNTATVLFNRNPGHASLSIVIAA